MFSEKHAPNSILKRGKYKGRDIFLYIINSTGVIKTSAESRKKLALRTVYNDSNNWFHFDQLNVKRAPNLPEDCDESKRLAG